MHASYFCEAGPHEKSTNLQIFREYRVLPNLTKLSSHCSTEPMVIDINPWLNPTLDIDILLQRQALGFAFSNVTPHIHERCAREGTYGRTWATQDKERKQKCQQKTA